MRGIAITAIILHNLLHMLLPTVENEFTFNIERSNTFAKYALEFNSSFWKDIFSFLGWYGVVVFIFLSGYGLTLKYGFTTEQPFKADTFVWKHIKRVFLLMILPYTLFAIIQIRQASYLQLFLQLTLLSNIFNPEGIFPGVFWFFGLIAQLYILFALIRNSNKVHHRGTILLSINALSLILTFCIPGDSASTNYIRHNFIGWILPFSMGIWFAQHNSLQRLFDSYRKNAMWCIVCGAFVVISNFNYYLWCISPIFAIMAFIGLTKVLTGCYWIDRGFIWLGALSSFLFAVHPTIRSLCLIYFSEEMTQPLYILGYVLISIATALVYRVIHKRYLSE